MSAALGKCCAGVAILAVCVLSSDVVSQAGEVSGTAGPPERDSSLEKIVSGLQARESATMTLHGLVRQTAVISPQDQKYLREFYRKEKVERQIGSRDLRVARFDIDLQRMRWRIDCTQIETSNSIDTSWSIDAYPALRWLPDGKQPGDPASVPSRHCLPTKITLSDGSRVIEHFVDVGSATVQPLKPDRLADSGGLGTILPWLGLVVEGALASEYAATTFGAPTGKTELTEEHTQGRLLQRLQWSITVSEATTRIRLWVSPAEGFAVTKAEMLTANRVRPGLGLRRLMVFDDLEERAPGVFLPSRSTEYVYHYLPGQESNWSLTEQVTFENLEVNSSFDDAAFAYVLPLGTLVRYADGAQKLPYDVPIYTKQVKDSAPTALSMPANHEALCRALPPADQLEAAE